MSQTSTPSEPTTFKVLPIMIALLLSGFIGMFSETALNIALNDLMQILHITTATAQWLTTAFLLTLGILVPVSGLLLQTFTTRQLFVASLLFSIAGCLVAALAPTFSVLLIARILQAVGTALLLPLMFNTILIIFPAEKRGAAMGIIGLVIMFAPAVGPTIAGLVLQNLSWHWIFWISLPFLVFSLIFGIFFMQNVSKITKPKIDILSILLSSIGFGGVVFGFSKSGEGGEGWASPVVLLPVIIGLIALILFSMRQLKMKQPMLNLRVFKYPMFVIGVVMIFLCMMTILSTMLILPLFLQKGLALSALTAGLVLLPGGIINGLLSPIMGSLFDKFGPKWLVIPGLAIVVAVLFFLSGITTTSAIVLIIVLHCCLMIGISMIMMPAQTNGLNQLPLELYPDGTAIMSTLQQVAGAIGTAIAVSILSKGMESYLSQSSMPESVNEMANAMVFGSQHSFFFAMIVSVIGLFIAFFIRRVHVKKGAAQAPMH
ncbi:DHA2 family efflux MFS transporter permease subunit [Paenibacillus peoriae]|uniref:DHA2 family efflux MFS transporter permease subunit n=1 Tax=Paenibacillus peoriae TaxID=59893 RepID=UPI0018D4B180|nr:DHA2 family efflux MFS transporter permease subunit [Paenibacillus peoriae]MEC0184149.1 DHA2 family efflux MFS transporter permease subunit [Paenibacillus peoriae]